MSKSTTQKSNESTSTQSPMYVQDAAKYLVNAGTNIADPFLMTPSARVAGFTPDQTAGMDYARNIAEAVSMSPNHYGGNTMKLGREFGNFSEMDPANISKWMSPYLGQAVGQTRAAMESDYRDKDASLAASYAAGPVVGSGGALARGQLARGANENVGNTVSQMYQQGYGQALGAAQAATQMTNQNIAQQRQDHMAVQRQASQLDTETLMRNLQALQGLQGSGQQQQQLNQRVLDVPLEMLQLLAGITPQDQSMTSQTQKKTESSGGGSILSGISGVLGIAKSLGFGCDRALKEDIEPIGHNEELDLPLYLFRYKGDPKTYPKVVGPMADEVEARYPGSTRIVNGFRVISGIPAQAA
jgi:hypothetical protein